MATIKQKLAFREVLKGTPVTRAMKKAGYALSTSETTGKLTRSDGFQELLEAVGLTDEFLTKALKEDIKKKKGNRVRELELGFKVKGRLKEKQDGGNTYNQINIYSDEQRRRIASRLLREPASEGTPDRLSNSDQPALRTELAP